MNKSLSLNDLDSQVFDKIYFQKYDRKSEVIDGVKIVEIHEHTDDESSFAEVLRISPEWSAEQFPGFKPRQVNHTTLVPWCVKAWHVHLKQDELWYIPSQSSLLVGLWDLRERSKTQGVKMRLNLGRGKAKLIHVPRGVAHGVKNTANTISHMFYITSQLFDKIDPDEGRISWDGLGADFWKPKRD